MNYWRSLYMIKILMKCYCPPADMDCSSHKKWVRMLPDLKPIKSWTTLFQRKRTKMTLLLQTHRTPLTSTMVHMSRDWLIQIWLTVFINFWWETSVILGAEDVRWGEVREDIRWDEVKQGKATKKGKERCSCLHWEIKSRD